MDKAEQSTQATTPSRIPLDVWAVLLALALAAFVRLGWLPGITW